MKIDTTMNDIVQIRTDLFGKCNSYTRADYLKNRNVYPYYSAIEKTKGSKVSIDKHVKLMMGGNSYLGIANDSKLKKAAKDAINKYGVGSTGARIIAGTFDIHSELEKKISAFLNREDSVIFPTGYQTNSGTISCLISRHEYVVLDSHAHASIVDGARLSFGNIKRFRHNNIEDLDRILRQLPENRILVAVDGVYSMEGDLANLPSIVQLCKKYKAKLLVDEAHSFGIFGKKGRGVCEHFNVESDVDLIVATFSKACGSLGGFVSANKKVINFIRHNGRGLLFSTGMPAAIIAAANEAFDRYIIPDRLRKVLWKNTNFIRNAFSKLGFNSGYSQSPIIPIIIGDDLTTTTFWKKLFDAGIFVGAMIPPAVPPNRSLLRISINASLSMSEIKKAVDIFKTIGRELNVIK